MEQTKLYTMKDLCQYLGIGRNTALTLINTQKIKAFKAGRHWLIPETSIEDYIHREVAPVNNNQHSRKYLTQNG